MKVLTIVFILFAHQSMGMEMDTIRHPATGKMLKVLENIMLQGKNWLKIHSAEYLIVLGYSDIVKKEFLHELDKSDTYGTYRIGVWRVLAQAETLEENKNKWISSIFEAFCSVDASERLHAMETLAKLKICPAKKYPEQIVKALRNDQDHLNLFALWATSYCSENEMSNSRGKFLIMALSHQDENVRSISCYVLRKLKGLSADQQSHLFEKSLADSIDSPLRYSLLHTAFVLTESREMRAIIKNHLLKGYAQFDLGKRTELAQALSEKGEADDIPILESLIYSEGEENEESAELRAAVAYAIMNIQLRNKGK